MSNAHSKVRYVSLDIETSMMDQERELAVRDSLIESLVAPANYKDEFKIAAWKAEKIEEIISKSSLDHHKGNICVIGVGYYDETGEWITTQFNSWAEYATEEGKSVSGEATMLRAFNDWLDYQTELGYVLIFCGKGLLRFDLPFICVKAFVHNVPQIFYKLPENRGPYTNSGSILDLEQQSVWPGSTRDSFIRLNDLAKLLGIEVEETVDGAEIPFLFKAEDYDPILKHNAVDLKVTMDIMGRLGRASVPSKQLELLF